MVPVGSSTVDTWYYSPAEFVSLFSQFFRKTALKPVGISVPPSYMEPFFRQRRGLLRFFGSVETTLNKVPFFAYLSDHYLIELQPA